MSEYFLSEINVYPVKSLGGISLQLSEITDRGLKYDRRWMVVDKEGMFLTQRTHAQMALVKVTMDQAGLTLTHRVKYIKPLTLPFIPESGKNIEVVVWNDKVEAAHVSTAADKWLSEVLNVHCKLVYMPDESLRVVDQKYSAGNQIVSFADAYPFLIIGQRSLDDLNSRLEENVLMNRFRPNFVFDGGEAFDEDKWKKFKIGNVIFESVKPCSRCVVTTINQETAEVKHEPLKTLAQYRLQNNHVNFGQNLIHTGRGMINVGDSIEILEWKQLNAI